MSNANNTRRKGSAHLLWAAAICLCIGQAACASQSAMRPFPLEAPLTVDPDMAQRLRDVLLVADQDAELGSLLPRLCVRRFAPVDPANSAADGHLIFLGALRTPWQSLDDCPKNLTEARSRGLGAVIEVDAAWRAALMGLAKSEYALVLYWMGEARRDLIMQQPRHKPAAAGVFSLRSPARPNPIAVATVQLLKLDLAAGRLTIDAVDCLDGTPLLDIKPWLRGVDCPPDTGETD